MEGRGDGMETSPKRYSRFEVTAFSGSAWEWSGGGTNWALTENGAIGAGNKLQHSLCAKLL